MTSKNVTPATKKSAPNMYTARLASGFDGCIVCGKSCRTDFERDVTAEQWELRGAEFVSGAGLPEATALYLTGTVNRARPWKICPAHRRFSGVAIREFKYGQLVRFVVRS